MSAEGERPKPTDVHELLAADVALSQGLASARDVAAALQRYWDERGHRPVRFVDELRRIADLAPEAAARIESEVARLLSECGGDAHEALIRRGGVDRSIAVELTRVGAPRARQALDSAGAVRSPLRTAEPERYLDFRPIGSGGMGIVYLALDTELNRRVAFKVVRPDLGEGLPPTEPASPLDLAPPDSPDTPASQAFRDLTQRFLQEAWVTGGLDHPGIVPVYELGQTPAGVPYYTMRFVRGQRTLEQGMEAATALEDRLGLLEPFLKLCDAVRYAHSQGVIHRDLKPSNVALGQFGEVVLLDWGLAKIKNRPDVALSQWQERLREFREANDLRTVAAALGTPGYMAPEAAKGAVEQVDERSDVYSLGVILYRILARRAPFEFASYGDFLRRLLKEDPRPPHLVDPLVPADLSAVCARALARDPASRTASVGALADGIRAWQRASERAREAGALRKEAEAALEGIEALAGDARLAQLDRIGVLLSRLKELVPDDSDVGRLSDEAARQRRGAVEQQAALARRQTLRRSLAVGSLVVLLMAGLGLVLLEGRRREAERARGEAQTAATEARQAEGRARASEDATQKSLRRARAVGFASLAQEALGQGLASKALTLAQRGLELELGDPQLARIALEAVTQPLSRTRASLEPTLRRLDKDPDRRPVIALSSDVVLQACASGGGYVPIDVTTGHATCPAAEVEVEWGGVEALAGGGLLVLPAGSNDGSASPEVRCWATATPQGECRLCFPQRPGACDVGRVPGGAKDLIYVAYDDGHLDIHALDGTMLAERLPVPRPIAIALEPEGARLAAWGADDVLSVWTIGGTRVAEVRAPTLATCHAIAWARNGTHVVAGFGDGQVLSWEVSSGTVRHVRLPDGADIATVQSADAGVWLVSSESSAAFLPIGEPEPLDVARAVEGERALQIALSGECMLVQRLDRSVGLRSQAGRDATDFVPCDARLESACLSHDGQTWCGLTAIGEVRWLQTSDSRALRSIVDPAGPIMSYRLSRQGHLLLTVNRWGDARLWHPDREGPPPILGPRAPDAEPWDALELEDGCWCVPSHGGLIRTWDREGVQSSMVPRAGRMSQQDGKWQYGGASTEGSRWAQWNDRWMVVFGADGRLLNTWDAANDEIEAAWLTEAGDRVVVLLESAQLVVIDSLGGEASRMALPQGPSYHGIWPTADGARALVSSDQLLLLIDTIAGVVHRLEHTHAGWVDPEDLRGADWDPWGEILLAWSHGTVLAWDRSGKSLFEHRAGDDGFDGVGGAAVSPVGDAIAVVDHSGRLLVFSLLAGSSQRFASHRVDVGPRWGEFARPRWDSAGRKIAVSCGRSTINVFRLENDLGEFDRGTALVLHRLLQFEADVRSFGWTSDGEALIVQTGNALEVRDVDATSRRILGAPLAELAESSVLVAHGRDRWLHVGSDGRILREFWQRAEGSTISSPRGDRTVVLPAEGGAVLRGGATAGVLDESHFPGFAVHAKFSAAGESILLVAPQAGVRLLEARSGRVVLERKGYPSGRPADAEFMGPDRAVLVEPDGGAVLVGLDGTVLARLGSAAQGMRVQEGGERVWTSPLEHQAWIWDRHGSLVGRLRHEDAFSPRAILPDGRVLFDEGAGIASLWAESGLLLRLLPDHAAARGEYYVSEKLGLFVSCGKGGAVEAYDLLAGRSLDLPLGTQAVDYLDDDGAWIAYTTSELGGGSVVRLLGRAGDHRAEARGVAGWQVGAGHVAIELETGGVILWDSTGRLVLRLDPPTGKDGLVGWLWNPEQREIALAERRGRLTVYGLDGTVKATVDAVGRWDAAEHLDLHGSSPAYRVWGGGTDVLVQLAREGRSESVTANKAAFVPDPDAAIDPVSGTLVAAQGGRVQARDGTGRVLYQHSAEDLQLQCLAVAQGATRVLLGGSSGSRLLGPEGQVIASGLPAVQRAFFDGVGTQFLCLGRRHAFTLAFDGRVGKQVDLPHPYSGHHFAFDAVRRQCFVGASTELVCLGLGTGLDVRWKRELPSHIAALDAFRDGIVVIDADRRAHVIAHDGTSVNNFPVGGGAGGLFQIRVVCGGDTFAVLDASNQSGERSGVWGLDGVQRLQDVGSRERAVFSRDGRRIFWGTEDWLASFSWVDVGAALRHVSDQGFVVWPIEEDPRVASLVDSQAPDPSRFGGSEPRGISALVRAWFEDAPLPASEGEAVARLRTAIAEKGSWEAQRWSGVAMRSQPHPVWLGALLAVADVPSAAQLAAWSEVVRRDPRSALEPATAAARLAEAAATEASRLHLRLGAHLLRDRNWVRARQHLDQAEMLGERALGRAQGSAILRKLLVDVALQQYQLALASREGPGLNLGALVQRVADAMARCVPLGPEHAARAARWTQRAQAARLAPGSPPSDAPRVWLEAAYLAYDLAEYVRSAAFFERALASTELESAEGGRHLYNAACSAALAAKEDGTASMRDSARALLERYLGQLRTRIEGIRSEWKAGDARARILAEEAMEPIERMLKHALEDPDLVLFDAEDWRKKQIEPLLTLVELE